MKAFPHKVAYTDLSRGRTKAVSSGLLEFAKGRVIRILQLLQVWIRYLVNGWRLDGCGSGSQDGPGDAITLPSRSIVRQKHRRIGTPCKSNDERIPSWSFCNQSLKTRHRHVYELTDKSNLLRTTLNQHQRRIRSNCREPPSQQHRKASPSALPGWSPPNKQGFHASIDLLC